MKALTLAIFLGALAGAGLAQAADLTIRIDNVKSADGQLRVAVFNSAETFQRKPVAGMVVPAVAGSSSVVVKDLAPGDYALVVLHDANGNGKMDANMMGMPVEDYGFSNNALGKMGPPSFEQARITVPADGLATSINLK
ncbi:DUF2141 domain-containing protein [Oxalobacteraceae bacterium A2-2]